MTPIGVTGLHWLACVIVALPMPRELYLIRHGMPENHLAVLGQSDPPLTEKGRQQARSLARLLMGRGIERIIASNLRRAAQTAEVISETLGLGWAKDARFNEISYGSWDGLRWEEIERRAPETAKRKLENWWEVTPEAGEAFSDFCRRVGEAWVELQRHPATVTAVVAHVGVNAVLADLARGVSTGGSAWAADWDFIGDFNQGFAEHMRVPLGAAR